jgi:hypothetical protein
VELFLLSDPTLSIPERRIRKLNAEISSYKVKKSEFLNSLKTCDSNADQNPMSEPTFRALDPIPDELGEVTRNNDYVLCFFGIFPLESFSAQDSQKLRSKKWERLKGTKFSTLEVDIVWRVWSACVITPKIAKLMGLFGNGNCAFCNQNNPNAMHLVHCSSAQGPVPPRAFYHETFQPCTIYFVHSKWQKRFTKFSQLPFRSGGNI